MIFLKSAGMFLFVCLLGWIVGSAGGVEWGTEAAGITALFTFLFALCMAAMPWIFEHS